MLSFDNEKTKLIFLDIEIETIAYTSKEKEDVAIILLENKYYVFSDMKDEFPSFYLMINISMNYKDFVKFIDGYSDMLSAVKSIDMS